MIPIGRPLPFGSPSAAPAVSTIGCMSSFIVTSMIMKSTKTTPQDRPVHSIGLEFSDIGFSPRNGAGLRGRP